MKLLAPVTNVNDIHNKSFTDNKYNGVFVPADAGYLMANFDPAGTSGSGSSLPANGVLYFQRVRIDISATISNIYYHLTGAGATLTANQNLVGLYSDAGALLGTSGDQSSSWTAAGFKASGLLTPVAVTAGYYKIAFLSNGTTRPSILRGPTGSQAIVGPVTTNPRFGSAGTGLTALPNTMPAMTFTNVAYWVGAA